MSDESYAEENAEESADLVYALAAAPGLVPGQHGLVFAGATGGLQRSADGGQTWTDALANLQLSEPLPVISLAASPFFAQDGFIIAGAPGGVFHSSDGGQSWRVALLPNPPPTVAALAISPSFLTDETVFAGTMEDGVFLSTDGGVGWTAWNFGLLDLKVICLAISPDFALDETVCIGAETGIFRSTNGGRAWRDIELPFGFDAVLSLAFSPNYTSDHTLYAGTEANGLWMSTDEGETWRRLDLGPDEEPANALLTGGPGELLAVTGTQLLRTTDGGATWANCLPAEYAEREISAALAPQGFAPGALLLVGFTDGQVETVRIH